MFIIYSNYEEVIICTPETEPEAIKQWFTEGGRDIEDYDRTTSDEAAVEVTTILRVE